MDTTRLGRTGLQVTRTGFGVLPLQRVTMAEATRILRRAFDAGITFYDTARAYSDSEEKIGAALGDVRDQVVIATKSGATTRTGVLHDLDTSLRNLRTDYVDILQLHTPTTLPDPDDPESSYAGLLAARRAGKVRHFGMTNHSAERAIAAVTSGLYETLQFPLCHISSPADLALIELCRTHDVGLIAMKPLCGGLLAHARPAFAFLRQFSNLVPIWGFQRLEELEELLALDADPPALDDALQAEIARDGQELAGEFCRACGYCLPCPARIPIPMAARMSLLLRRMPYQQFLTPEWQEQMRCIKGCVECNHCRRRCPYGLDTPALLKRMLADYEAFLAEQEGR
ncbi:MAG TPA: aldo/keto reductase [Armatimonadota bacterium]|jgi:predicted aldo/keto reductase-like oxidoreductase